MEDFHRGFESMLQTNKPDVWKFLEAINRKQALHEFTVTQQKVGKQVVKENENYGRIKRIVCAAHEYQQLENLRAIASNMLF